MTASKQTWVCRKQAAPCEGDAPSANAPSSGLAPSLLTLRLPQGTMKPPYGDLSHNHGLHASPTRHCSRKRAATGRASVAFPSLGDPSAGSLKNLCPGQKATLHSEIRVRSLKAGEECECQAQDLAERLSKPSQSCWLRSYGLLKSPVHASAETGNICRCCYQSAALDLSHP